MSVTKCISTGFHSAQREKSGAGVRRKKRYIGKWSPQVSRYYLHYTYTLAKHVRVFPLVIVTERYASVKPWGLRVSHHSFESLEALVEILEVLLVVGP